MNSFLEPNLIEQQSESEMRGGRVKMAATVVATAFTTGDASNRDVDTISVANKSH